MDSPGDFRENAGMKRKLLAAVVVGGVFAISGCAGPSIKERMVSPDPRVRSEAVQDALKIKNHALYRATVKGATGYLFSPDPAKRARAAESFGAMGPWAGEFVPDLEPLLKDEDAGVREASRKAIMQISGNESTVQATARETLMTPSSQVSVKMTIAVTDLSAEGVSQSNAAIVADWLRGALVTNGAYTVVERSAMQRVLAEQAFQQTGCTSQECAVRLGKVLNVQRIVVGSFGQFLDSYVLNVRVVDVESGGIIYSDSAKGKTTDEVEANIHALADRLSGGRAPAPANEAPAQVREEPAQKKQAQSW